MRLWFGLVISSRAGPERPYRLCYMRFRPIGMHGRGGACRRSSFTGRDSTAHPCHVALQLHAPLNCRGTLAVKGIVTALGYAVGGEVMRLELVEVEAP